MAEQLLFSQAAESLQRALGLEHTGVTGVQVTTAAIDRLPDAAPVTSGDTGATFRISW
ncbi:MAG: hypothetical protein JNM17_25365 [Archangium sp.]|nr:hypothetical protein [Archangium sp.]